MDAKSKAHFINSVAGGKIPCAVCGTLNEADSMFCMSCGNNLLEKKDGSESSNQPVGEKEENKERKHTDKDAAKAAFDSVPVAATLEEEVSVFAEGLPSWDIVPPQVMVRRKRK